MTERRAMPDIIDAVLMAREELISRGLILLEVDFIVAGALGTMLAGGGAQ